MTLRWWFVTISICFCNSQIFPSNWFDDGCIPEDEYFICLTLESLRKLSWIRHYVSFVNIELESTASSLTPIYLTDAYQIDNTNVRELNGLSICFYPNISTINDPSIQFNIYNITNNNSTLLALHSMNIEQLNLNGKEPPIPFTENLNFNTTQTSLNISDINPIPTIQYFVWISSSQCLEITTGTMYFTNDYSLNTNLYRLNQDKNEITENRMFETSKLLSFDESQRGKIIFNSILCLPQFPTNKNSEALIGGNFTLNDGTTSRSYSLSTINNNKYIKYYVTPNPYWQQLSYDNAFLHFAIGNIEIIYWQSCSLTNSSLLSFTTTESILYFTDTFEEIATLCSRYTIILLIALLFMMFICIISGCYTCKSYKNTDPIHYSNI